MKGPCLNCTDRKVGCHSTCEKYKSYREYKDEENKKIKQSKQIYSDLYAIKNTKFKRRWLDC